MCFLNGYLVPDTALSSLCILSLLVSYWTVVIVKLNIFFCLNVTRLAFALSSPSWWQDSLNYSSSTLFIIESSRKVSLTLIQVWIKVLGLTVTGSDWVPFLTLMEFTCSTSQAGLGIREVLVSPGKDTRRRHQELNRCWVARTASVTGLIQEEKKNNMTLNS